MKVLLFAIGTAVMPILMVFGFGIYIASRQPVPPPLIIPGSAGLTLGLVTLVGFLACIVGLHRAFMARQRARQDSNDA
ncbi:hypothetical protein [Denitromonas iodatirespirans]|uniref:Uncharacterized protein n=1 Tax=Denitromonas iodatirespirans TaxID=2795389 RepID=A0A944DL63_DENI1|nr:hypothetical protein [Denitromonas iodatirespirans]MBT0960739.1 hypothetical protein [Denitromonas iodatirespirans]